MAITELGGVAGTLKSRTGFCTHFRNWCSVIIPTGFNSMKAKFKYFISKKVKRKHSIKWELPG